MYREKRAMRIETQGMRVKGGYIQSNKQIEGDIYKERNIDRWVHIDREKKENKKRDKIVWAWRKRDRQEHRQTENLNRYEDVKIEGEK